MSYNDTVLGDWLFKRPTDEVFDPAIPPTGQDPTVRLRTESTTGPGVTFLQWRGSTYTGYLCLFRTTTVTYQTETYCPIGDFIWPATEIQDITDGGVAAAHTRELLPTMSLEQWHGEFPRSIAYIHSSKAREADSFECIFAASSVDEAASQWSIWKPISSDADYVPVGYCIAPISATVGDPATYGQNGLIGYCVHVSSLVPISNTYQAQWPYLSTKLSDPWGNAHSVYFQFLSRDPANPYPNSYQLFVDWMNSHILHTQQYLIPSSEVGGLGATINPSDTLTDTITGVDETATYWQYEWQLPRNQNKAFENDVRPYLPLVKSQEIKDYLNAETSRLTNIAYLKFTESHTFDLPLCSLVATETQISLGYSVIGSDPTLYSLNTITAEKSVNLQAYQPINLPFPLPSSPSPDSTGVIWSNASAPLDSISIRLTLTNFMGTTDVITLTTIVPDITPPIAPTSLVAHAIADTSITLRWSGASDDAQIAYYRLTRRIIVDPLVESYSTQTESSVDTSTADGVWYVLPDATGTTLLIPPIPAEWIEPESMTTTWVDPDTLLPWTHYVYTLETVDTSDLVAAVILRIDVQTTDHVAPASPTDLVTASVVDQGVQLTWTLSVDPQVVEYRIYRNDIQIGITNGQINTLMDSTARSFHLYYYRVNAVDGAGNVSDNTCIILGDYQSVDFWSPQKIQFILETDTTTMTNVEENNYTETQTDTLSEIIATRTETETETSTMSDSTTNTSTLTHTDFYVDYTTETETDTETFTETDTGTQLVDPPYCSSDFSGAPILVWKPAQDDGTVTALHLYRDGVFITNLGPTETTYTDSIVDIPAGTRLIYNLVAEDAAGNVSEPSYYSYTVPDMGSARVNRLSVRQVLSTTNTVNVYVEWLAEPKAVSWILSRSINSGTWTDIPIATSSTITYLDSSTFNTGDVVRYTLYYIDFSTQERTTWGSGQCTVTDVLSPAAPALFRATWDATAQSVHLSWDSSSDNVAVTHYKLERGVTVLSETIPFAQPYYEDIGTGITFTPGQTYMYRVSAIDLNGNVSAATTTTITIPSPGLQWYWWAAIAVGVVAIIILLFWYLTRSTTAVATAAVAATAPAEVAYSAVSPQPPPLPAAQWIQ